MAAPPAAGSAPSSQNSSRLAEKARSIPSRIGLFESREWLLAVESEDWWLTNTASCFSTLKCCAFCGEAAFSRCRIPVHDDNYPPSLRSSGRQLHTIPAPAGATPPYAMQCAALASACVTSTGMWNVCSLSKTKPASRATLQPSVTPALVKALLGMQPSVAQLLSAVDVSVSFTSKLNGFMRGSPTHASLFDSPLLLYNARDSRFLASPPSNLISFRDDYLANNPVLAQFVSILERPHPLYGVPFLHESDVDLRKVLKASSRDPRNVETILTSNTTPSPDIPESISVLAPIDASARTAALSTVGNVLKWNATPNEQPLSFLCDLNMSSSPNSNIGFEPECVMFPMLFPDGSGHKPQKNATLPSYLQYRCSQLFSPFTLYKPYLPLMYSALRTHETLSNVSETYLLREVQALRSRDPTISDNEVFRSLVKNVLPSKTPGTPSYFGLKRSQLLAAARKFGMPALFLTLLTADELSELRWPEIDDLENILHKVHPNLSWKDAPAECVSLFKHRIDLFMKST